MPSVLTDGKTPFAVKPPWPGSHKTGRRLAFAQWLVRPEHPLTARVMVNRMWREHFGVGIVRTLANFGKAGAAPTHPEMLDWLALEFVDRGWSQKAIHRLIVTSSAYRQASKSRSDTMAADPDNRLLTRQNRIRLDAGIIPDASLVASGVFDSKVIVKH